MPEMAWFRGPLLPELRQLLSGSLCAESYGVFSPGAGRSYLQTWESGSTEISYKELFGLISLELWLRKVEPFLRGEALAAAA
jgi:hypothetical protein